MESKLATTAEIALPQPPKQWKLRLFCRGTERLRVLRVGDCITLGSGEEATVTIADPAVSSVHCQLIATEAGLEVRDTGSRNGVFVGAGRVATALLAGPHASFSIGHTTVVVEPRAQRQGSAEHWGLVGESEPIVRLREAIARFARLSAPVLIVGESGTGKDLVAHLLHRLSGRRGPYVPLNVAALSESLIDAELFGHVRGAFTGAEANRPGAFVQADGGSLFLDEIADLAIAGQSKLLRVVEDRMVRAVGATQARLVDVRIISATCIALEDRMAQERFRSDLYHRLSTLVVWVPPLRQRRSDIPLIAAALLERMSDEVGARTLHPATLDVLCQYSWPGNVRQLGQVLYRAAALFPGDLILPGHVQIEQDLPRRNQSLDLARARLLLAEHASVSAAARAAGVPRTTFRSVLERGGRSK